MKFILTIRPLTEKDITVSTPFLPEADDYDMYLRALCEDIKKVDKIIAVTKNNSSLYIETNEPLDEEELKNRIKPVFTKDLMNNLRFVSLVKYQSQG